MKYPTLISMRDDGGWAAILEGHNLPQTVLDRTEVEMIGEPDDGWFTEVEMIGEPDDGWFTEVEEVYLEWVPRVKWCSRYPLSDGFGCDNEGQWHGHWFAVQDTPHERCHFTVIRHTDIDSADGSE
jgi:hypothetical protein